MNPQAPAEQGPSRHQVWRMFDRIAHRYDLLNRLLSFGRDVAWRKLLVGRLPECASLRVLDLATGTGDVLLAIHRQTGRVALGVGADMSWGMLQHGAPKIARCGSAGELHLIRADATGLGVAPESFDAVTIAFGIRNLENLDAGFGEMYRVLRPGGRALILEFSLPRNLTFRALYLFYFRHVLPRVGGLISGDHQAYRYLNQTVETFPYGEAFCARMGAAGFENIVAHPLTFWHCHVVLRGSARRVIAVGEGENGDSNHLSPQHAKVFSIAVDRDRWLLSPFSPLKMMCLQEQP